MTPELIKYYEDLDEMFATAGWRNLIEDSKKAIYQLQADALEAKNFETVCFHRGQAEELARLINLKEVATSMRAEAEKDDLDDASL